MLAILVFSVVIWMFETVSYPVSAAIIISLMAFLLGTAPNMMNPDKVLGTSGALKMAMSGFSSPALALVGAALFISAAMMKTGLDKRLALFILSKIGAKTKNVLAGVILVGFILSFFVPSTTARVSCMVPIVMGIIAAFGVPLKSRFSAMIPIIISVLQGAAEYSHLNVVGMTLILQYVICFGFILPVNAPQNMVAFGTETFEAKTFIKTGIPLTVIAYSLIMLMAATYWKWLGIII